MYRNQIEGQYFLPIQLKNLDISQNTELFKVK